MAAVGPRGHRRSAGRGRGQDHFVRHDPGRAGSPVAQGAFAADPGATGARAHHRGACGAADQRRAPRGVDRQGARDPRTCRRQHQQRRLAEAAAARHSGRRSQGIRARLPWRDRQPAHVLGGRVGPRRGQLAAVERPDRAPRAAAAFHRRRRFTRPSLSTRCALPAAPTRCSFAHPAAAACCRSASGPASIRSASARPCCLPMRMASYGSISLSPIRADISPRTKSSTERSMPRRSPGATS